MPRLENPEFHQVHLRLPTDLHAATLNFSKAEERSLSYVVRQALHEFLQARGYLSANA